MFGAFACNEKNQLERNIGISFMRGTKSESWAYSLKDPYSVLDNMPGTPRYWQKKKYDLIARIENLDPFNLFFTLSCGEKRMNEYFTTFLQDHGVRYIIENGLEQCTIDGIALEEYLQREENASKHEFIRKNILTATLNFNQTVKEFIKNIMMNIFGPFHVEYYNYRVEFQLRGSGHLHGTLWLDFKNLVDSMNKKNREEKNKKTHLKQQKTIGQYLIKLRKKNLKVSQNIII